MNLFRKLLLYLIIFGTSTLLMNSLIDYPTAYAFSYNSPEADMKPVIEEMYKTRSEVFVTTDLAKLKPLFDLSRKYGIWTLEHEVRRVKYLADWSKKRDIKFIHVESTIRIKKIYKKDDILRFALEESNKFDYIYNHDEMPKINSFGVGLRHTLSLINKEGKWLIYSDWYTDCFEDAMGIYSGTISTESAIAPNFSNEASSQETKANLYGYNRQKAVEYADKYCGAAWGSDNNFKYNKKYPDYNGQGGDCTNYVSQVLGDAEGGGMKQSRSWYKGTHSWSNVDGLKAYIINNGKGYIIGKGSFDELTKPRENAPNGIISKLKLSDLICYVKKDDPNHFAVITGADSHGYPLINSHTTDRYHVPWDLGWGNKNITFILIHITG